MVDAQWEEAVRMRVSPECQRVRLFLSPALPSVEFLLVRFRERSERRRRKGMTGEDERRGVNGKEEGEDGWRREGREEEERHTNSNIPLPRIRIRKNHT